MSDAWVPRRLAIGILTALGGTACTTTPLTQAPPTKPASSSPDPAKATQSDSTLAKSKQAKPKQAKDAKAEPSGPPWASATFSPRPGSVGDDRLSAVEEACGTGDAALHGVALAAAERQAQTGAPMDLEEVGFEMRRQGVPYVMPRMWAAEARAEDVPQLPSHVATWAKAPPLLGVRRCGVGAVDQAGSLFITVVAVDVLAELEPLATQVDLGTRVDLGARLGRSPTAASVILLPPTGAPFSVASELERGHLTARFTPTAPGPWLVQVMATHVGGPRPVAQAILTVGEEPPVGFAQTEVPGEEDFDPKLAPGDALFSLLNAARKEHGLPLLARNRQLDRVAQEHCRAMKSRGQVSHDTGAGDPARRVEEAGLRPQATGENVALAKTVPRLHRVLWASPSHRENVLLRRWDQAGVAVVEKDDGSLLATEVFIDL
jgi:uncharacterized protein YkwD